MTTRQPPLWASRSRLYLVAEVIMHLYSLEPDVLYYPSAGEEITSIFESLEFEFYKQHSWGYRYIDLKIEELFIIVNTSLPIEHTHLMVDVELQHHLPFIRQEMMAFPERNWSVQNISNRLNISESRLYSLYRSLFGTTPNRDLIMFRIERAKKLLEQGLNLQTVAENSGYNNMYHFIRQFHKETQLTPHQYIIHNKNVNRL